MLIARMLLDQELKYLGILLSSTEEGFSHVVHYNFEVEALNQAINSMDNDGLFDNEENNSTCV